MQVCALMPFSHDFGWPAPACTEPATQNPAGGRLFPMIFMPVYARLCSLCGQSGKKEGVAGAARKASRGRLFTMTFMHVYAVYARFWAAGPPPCRRSGRCGASAHLLKLNPKANPTGNPKFDVGWPNGPRLFPMQFMQVYAVYARFWVAGPRAHRAGHPKSRGGPFISNDFDASLCAFMQFMWAKWGNAFMQH